MVIGSSAIKHYFPDFPRNPKDLDIVPQAVYGNFVLQDNPELVLSDFKPAKISGAYYSTIEVEENTVKTEKLINPVLLKYYKYNLPKYIGKDELYTLKISHLFWDLPNKSWEKHIWDVQWLKEKKCKFIPDLFNQLYDYWNIIHGKNKRSNLEMSAENFFDNAITFPIPHDDLHELLIQHDYFRGQDKPTYTKVLKNNAEVDVDEEKFNKLSELEKYNLVFEEVAVMSTERYNRMYYKAAYQRMLKKFILAHAPIWEAVWIIQNHKKLLTTIPFNFLEFLKNK